MDLTIIISVLVLYLIVLLGIGAWGARDTKNLAGYYLANKRLPGWVVGFSSNATGESGWLLLGLTGMGYAVGAHALWVVLGEVLGVTCGWVLVAIPFKHFTDRYGSITVPDYLESRLRDKNQGLRLVSAVIVCSMVIAYTAAQMTASGKAFDAFLGTGYTGGVLIGAAVIFYYTTIGGFKAVAYSDFVQGLLMFCGLLVLPVVGVVAAGGWIPMMSTLREIDPNLLQPMGEFGLSKSGIFSALSFTGIGLAFLGAPQLLTRFMAARSRDDIVSGSAVAVITIIVFDIGAVLTGMAGRALFPGLLDSEMILPQMASALLPSVLTGVFMVIVLAAIMSTADSLLILASSSVVRDVMQKVVRPQFTEYELSRYGKVTTVLIGLAALTFALGAERVIFWFVLFAWSGLASAFAPVVLCSLFWRRTTWQGAVAGMTVGFLATVSWVLIFKDRFYDLYEMFPGFAAGFIVTIAVSVMTKPNDEAVQEFDEIWKEVNY